MSKRQECTFTDREAIFRAFWEAGMGSVELTDEEARAYVVSVTGASRELVERIEKEYDEDCWVIIRASDAISARHKVEGMDPDEISQSLILWMLTDESGPCSVAGFIASHFGATGWPPELLKGCRCGSAHDELAPPPSRRKERVH